MSNEATTYRTNFTEDVDVTDKYRNMYDEQLDPFQKFHRQEETRRYHSLNPAEKIVLGITKALSGNRRSRLCFVTYSGVLHILVFYVIYQWSIAPPCAVGKFN